MCSSHSPSDKVSPDADYITTGMIKPYRDLVSFTTCLSLDMKYWNQIVITAIIGRILEFPGNSELSSDIIGTPAWLLMPVLKSTVTVHHIVVCLSEQV